MTKAENRAAAKAFDEDRERKRREEWRAQAVAADLDQLDKLRRYLIFDTKAREPARELAVRGLLTVLAESPFPAMGPTRCPWS